MLYKNYKNLKISALGMGCMRLPRIDSTEKIDYKKAEQIIDYAYQNGINYFDTAYPYHNGESEIFIGNALKKYPRNTFYLATKFPIWEVKGKNDLQRIFDEQLKKCGVDYFDFYLCHALSMERHYEYLKYDAYNFFLKQQQLGKIRYFGFSFHDSVDALKVIIKDHKWDFAQIQFNYLDYDMQNAKEQYELLKDNGIPTIVMEPVRGGFLAEITKEAETIYKKINNNSIASWAIRYAINFDNNFVVLSGMSNMEQIIDNINTANSFKKLTDEELEAIYKVKKIILGQNYIPCTKCKYCIDCPKNIEIFNCFAFFNEYQINKDKERLKKSILSLKCHPIECLKCKKCMKLCPQGINIIKKLEEIVNLINC